MHRACNIRMTLCAVVGLFWGASCPAQDTDFRGWEETPGLYFYLLQSEAAWQSGLLAVETTPVHDHVSGATALKLAFPAAERNEQGVAVYRPPGAAVPVRAGYAGISIWVKGDGSDGVGVLGIGEGKPLDPRVTFRLAGKSWEPLRVRWEDFDRPVPAGPVPSLFFGVTSETKRPASYTVDRIELIRGLGAMPGDDELRATGESSAKVAETPRPVDLGAFATQPADLASFRKQLAERKRARVLVIGDAVAQGAGLWNVPPGSRARFLFAGALERAAKVNLPESTLDVIVVDSPEAAAEQIGPALAKFKPELVVIEMSCSPPGPAGFGAVGRARESIKSVIAACRAAKAEVVALAVPPLPDPFKRMNYAPILLEQAAAAGVPAIDFGRFAAARGKGFEGEYYATTDQLNVQGQILAARLLAASVMP